MSAPEKRRILVLVGTDHHPFDRVVAWADQHQLDHPDDDVFVQYARTAAPERAGGAAFLDPPELAAAVKDADVVITHGGPGTISNARVGGHRPLVVPRDPERGEHIDDHQCRFAVWASDRGLVTRIPEVSGLDEVIENLGEQGTRWDVQVADDTAVTVARVAAVIESDRRGEGRVVAPDAPVVVYLAGPEGSGTALVAETFARFPDAVVLGQVTRLWEHGLRYDAPCSCGEPFSRCPFWTAVGAHAFGGWAEVDLDHVLALSDAVAGRRWVRPRRITRAQLMEFTDHHRRLFLAARDVSGARVVVDASGVAAPALAFGRDRHIDLRVLRPTGSGLARLRPGGRRLGRHGVPVGRVRHDDLLADPIATVGSAWRTLRLPEADRSPEAASPTHQLVGLPTAAATAGAETRSAPFGYQRGRV